MKKTLILFLLWRLALFVPLYLGYQFVAYRPGYHYTSPSFFVDRSSKNPVTHFLVSPWANFDGVYYLLIGSRGYTVEAGFFPLFPMSLRPLLFLFGSASLFMFFPYVASIVLVSIYFLAGLFLLYRLIRLDYDEHVATRSIVFLLLFPTAFFFATVYAESLFFLLAVATLYLARKRQWLLASCTCALLTATRPVGLAMVPALFWEFFTQEHVISAGKIVLSRLTKAAVLLLSPLGLIAYMIFNAYKWGNFLYFVRAQGQFQNNRSVGQIVLFPQTVVRYFKILVGVPISQFEWWIALLEISVFFIAIVLFYIAWKKKVRTSYLIFALLSFLVPTATGTFTGLPRYVIVLFPLFLTLALMVRRRALQIGYMIAGGFLLGLLFLFFSRGFFIA